MLSKIRKINNDLFNWYSSLNNKDKYTNPYLIVPEDSYVNSKMKVLVLGKETNGWGEAENCKTCKELEDLYIEKIIGKEVGNIPFWNFYFNYLLPVIPSNVGVCASNISLLGYRYGSTGYNIKLAKELGVFFERYLNALKPDMVICFAGFGTKTRREYNYLEIMERIWGTYNQDNDLIISSNNEIKWPLRKLCFTNSNICIYGTRHPERTSKEWKESISYSIKEIIDTKLHEK